MKVLYKGSNCCWSHGTPSPTVDEKSICTWICRNELSCIKETSTGMQKATEFVECIASSGTFLDYTWMDRKVSSEYSSEHVHGLSLIDQSTGCYQKMNKQQPFLAGDYCQLGLKCVAWAQKVSYQLHDSKGYEKRAKCYGVTIFRTYLQARASLIHA